MARKKASKKKSDFYSEGLNFSDDPEDSFYATDGEDEETTQKKTSDKKKVFGFYIWEFAVIVIEIALIVYFVLVLLGLALLL